MNNDMKCPFCGKEMLCGGTICRYDPDCPIYDKPVPIEILELLSHTRKALEIAIDGLKSADEYYMYCAKKKTLQNDAGLVAFGMDNTITKALDEITALEQKDK